LFDTPQKRGLTPSANISSTSSRPIQKPQTSFENPGGCRKVRWSTSGTGKRGAARVIDFIAPEGTVWLLMVYSKAKFDNLPASFLAQLKKGVEDAI
jgi:hypothetical protein